MRDGARFYPLVDIFIPFTPLDNFSHKIKSFRSELYNVTFVKSAIL